MSICRWQGITVMQSWKSGVCAFSLHLRISSICQARRLLLKAEWDKDHRAEYGREKRAAGFSGEQAEENPVALSFSERLSEKL